MANIEQDFEFDYAAESAKVGFQSTVNALLEMQSFISSRMTGARERCKDGSYFSNDELKIYSDWILDTASALMEHYREIDKTNRFLNKRFKLIQFTTKRKAHDKAFIA